MSLYLCLNHFCGSAETQIQIAAPDFFFIKYFKVTSFDLSNSIKMATIYKNVFSNQVFFYKISSSLANRKEAEPEQQFVISAPAPGSNLISAPRFSAPAPEHCP
jgi:hypothetical protein